MKADLCTPSNIDGLLTEPGVLINSSRSGIKEAWWKTEIERRVLWDKLREL